jgi:hypothetical protein
MALVAVNNAVTNGACPGSARAAGSIISAVPMKIAPRKAIGTIRAGYCHGERPRTAPPRFDLECFINRQKGCVMQRDLAMVLAPARGHAA